MVRRTNVAVIMGILIRENISVFNNQLGAARARDGPRGQRSLGLGRVDGSRFLKLVDGRECRRIRYGKRLRPHNRGGNENKSLSEFLFWGAKKKF